MDGPTIIKRLEAMRAERSPYEDLYRDCFLYTDPARADGFMGDMDHEAARSYKANLCDSTAPESMRMLVSMILSGLTPSNSQWFGLDVDGASDQERRWLSNAARFVWTNIHNANYDSEAFEAGFDLGAAGWFVMFVGENEEQGGYAFETYDIGSCFITSTRSDGYPDTLYRQYKLTAEQAVKEFGEDKVSDKIRKAADLKPGDQFEFVHCIAPRKEADGNARMAKNLPFASYHVEKDAKRILRESGYHEQPFIAPRLRKIRAWASYGIGFVADALPDIKSLNELCRLELDAAGMAVEGQWVMEDDGVINPRQIKLGRRRVIVANSVDSIKALPTGSDFNVSFTIKASLQAAIRKALIADQLPPADGPAKTAYEYSVRVDMMRQALGPIYGRLQAEWLRQLVERCFGIAMRAGVLGQPPESLQGRDFTVIYQSPMARAQKMEDVAAMDRFEMSLAAQMQQLAPVDMDAAVALADNYDADLAARKRAEYLGVPADLVPDSRVIEKKRALREQKKQQQQQQAILNQGAMAAAEAGGQAMGAQLAGAT
jgi:hypothetical protein